MASQALLDFWKGISDDRVIVCLDLVVEGISYKYCDEIYDYTCSIDGVQTTFSARALEVKRPSRNGSGVFQTSIKVDDVDRVLWQLLRDLDRADTHSINIYLVLVSTGINEVSWNFKIDSAGFDGFVCSITATKPKIINKKFPIEIYSLDNFSGLEAV